MIRKTRGSSAIGLPHQVGPRPLPHGVGHITHLLGALVGPEHLADQHAGIAQARQWRSAGSRLNRLARATSYWVRGANSSRADSAAGAAATGTGAGAGAAGFACWANSQEGAARKADAIAT